RVVCSLSPCATAYPSSPNHDTRPLPRATRQESWTLQKAIRRCCRTVSNRLFGKLFKKAGFNKSDQPRLRLRLRHGEKFCHLCFSPRFRHLVPQNLLNGLKKL